VRTSLPAASAASSTPITTSASNEFPSSRSSSTLSEFELSTSDSPCKSPDRPAERDPLPARRNGTVSTLWLFGRTAFVPAAIVVLAIVRLRTAFTGATLRVAVRLVLLDLAGFLTTARFVGATFLGAVLVPLPCLVVALFVLFLALFFALFFVFFLAAMCAVYIWSG
jgi:hypothetical protein